MIIEILGTRVLSPHFGAALYIWTAQIGVALACLAAGYWTGGRLARHGEGLLRAGGVRLCIGALSGLAGLWMLGIPTLARAGLPLLHGADLRVGALAGSMLLFAAPLFLLACLPPVCVGALATETASAGTVAGRIYAVSTLGSFAMTMCLGFWLIPAHSISGTIQGFGAILLAAGAVGVLIHSMPARNKAIMLAALFGLGGVVATSKPGSLNGDGIVYRCDSRHTEIAVLDAGGYRALLLDRVGHGVLRLEDRMPIDPHFYYLNALTSMRPQGRQALLLGVAGGCALRAMEDAELCWDAVELDEEVLEVARRFFDLPDSPRIRYVVADGRTFLRAADRHYDFIVMDTYASGGVPRHLCSKEAFDDARRVMRPGGILAVNQLGSRTDRNSRGWKATWHTLAAVFKHVRAFSSHSRPFPGELGVMVIFASDAPLDVVWDDLASTGLSEAALGHLLRMQSRELREPPGPGMVLTDDRNPIEGWALEAAASVRAAWAARLNL